jgi:hypothetical protein
MNKSAVVGFLGEVLVKNRLESEGVGHVKHKGNQHGIDLQFDLGGRHVGIDVKTSLQKDERKWGFKCWGWALHNESKRRPITATHFVCVGLSELLEVQSLYVIKAADVSLFPPASRRFKNVTNALMLPCSNLAPQVVEPQDASFAVSKALLSLGTVIAVRENGHLGDACR